MFYYIIISIIHYANNYFHNVENTQNLNRLTNSIAEVKRELQTIKTQLENKHIIETQNNKSYWSIFIDTIRQKLF